jgi:hypothetical protein
MLVAGVDVFYIPSLVTEISAKMRILYCIPIQHVPSLVTEISAKMDFTLKPMRTTKRNISSLTKITDMANKYLRKFFLYHQDCTTHT